MEIKLFLEFLLDINTNILKAIYETLIQIDWYNTFRNSINDQRSGSCHEDS